LIVPMRAEAPDGTIGNGAVEIGPGDPEYDDWVKWIEQHPEDVHELTIEQGDIGKAARSEVEPRTRMA
jgi:hypothetical protein